MKRLVLSAVLVAACATVPPSQPLHEAVEVSPEVAARAHLEQLLASLPACAAPTALGVVTVSPGICTQRACPANACCNACGWNATWQKANVDAARVSSLFVLPSSAYDCEIEAWNRVFSFYDVNLEQGCVSR